MSALAGKALIVTGAGGGIGQTMARVLARAGARVVVTDIREDATHAVRDRIVEEGGEAVAVVADVTREDSVRALVAAALATCGRLDVLVNNSGGDMPRDRDIPSMDEATWDATFALNAKGPMLCCKHAIPAMLAQGGGVIVNVVSGAALTGQLGLPAYAAAKAAVISLTRSVATMHGRQGIRCNAIAPGLIMHERLAKVLLPEIVRIDSENLLCREPGTPEDVANAVMFLASDAARFINGHVLPVDGGLLAHTPFFAQMLASRDDQPADGLRAGGSMSSGAPGKP